MSAERLREAAALMRSRAEVAEKAHGSPWRPMGAKSVVYPMTKNISGTVAETYPTGGSQQQVATTEHIASWHPAVALAVADLLDTAPCSCAPCSCCGVVVSCDGCDERTAALAVADAYLGAPS